MEKVIYINLGGRVLPIEEQAAKKLETYLDSLRHHFRNEEGRDEIIEDIEDRFSEHFQEFIARGKPCVQLKDAEEVIALMGRPEDFEESPGSETPKEENKAVPPKKLYRNTEDKVLGGVCSGIANYFATDAVLIRILFVLVFLGGLGIALLIYVLLWVIVPVNPEPSHRVNRLFRSRDNRMIGGVAAGLGAYFGVSPVLPRLVFLIPFLLTVIGGLIFFPFNLITPFVFGSFSGTMLLIYLVLWIVLPEAKTRADKLEMQGENVNLQNIFKSVKEDVKTFGEKAKKKGKEWGKEIEEAGEKLESDLKSTFNKDRKESFKRKTKQFGKELNESLQKHESSFTAFFRVLGILIAGSVFLVFMAVFLFAVFFSSQVQPLLHFLIYTSWDKWLFHSLLSGLPFLLFWSSGLGLLRMFTGKNIALSVVQGITVFMWAGLIALIAILSWNYSLNFRYKGTVANQVYALNNLPQGSVLKVRNAPKPQAVAPLLFTDKVLLHSDTLYLQMVELKISRSTDSVFKVFLEGEAYSANTAISSKLLTEQKDIVYTNGTVYIPTYFCFPSDYKVNFKTVTCHIHIPDHIESDVKFVY